MASLYSGSDIVYIFSHVDAAPVIKSYSPDLIVYPTFSMSGTVDIPNVFSRLSCLLIGPGLSRQEYILKQSLIFLKESIKRKIPVIVDADGLALVSKYPEYFKNSILTPNYREFLKLCQEFNLKETNQEIILQELCQKLDCIILLKGKYDYICNGIKTVKVEEEGSLRRVGGLGDILSGIVSTFISFTDQEFDKNLFLQQVVQACILTRKSSLKAFQVKKRRMRATDVLQEINLEDILPSEE
jgi:ATP-dependent NAD(P)H-hydrate dehydratase